MSSGHDFKYQLSAVNHLYFKASAPGKKLIGSSMVAGSNGEKWKIALVLIPDASDCLYFEKTLTFSDLQVMTKTLGEFSWTVFFQQIKGVLKGSELVFDSTTKDCVHLYFPKREGGLSSPFDITVPQPASADNHFVSSFLFSCIERIQTLEIKVQSAESAAATTYNKLLEATSPKKTLDPTSGVGAVTLVGSKAAPPSPDGKKPSGSLLNPRAKKCVPKNICTIPFLTHFDTNPNECILKICTKTNNFCVIEANALPWCIC